MKATTRFYHRDVCVNVPWESESENPIKCRPFQVTAYLPSVMLSADPSQDGITRVKIVEFRCPLGFQKFVLLEDADFKEDDMSSPISFDAIGWLEHNMCGSILCPAARRLMTYRRALDVPPLKNQWMVILTREMGSSLSSEDKLFFGSTLFTAQDHQSRDPHGTSETDQNSQS